MELTPLPTNISGTTPSDFSLTSLSSISGSINAPASAFEMPSSTLGDTNFSGNPEPIDGNFSSSTDSYKKEFQKMMEDFMNKLMESLNGIFEKLGIDPSFIKNMMKGSSNTNISDVSGNLSPTNFSMSGVSGLSGNLSPSDFSMSGISGLSGNLSPSDFSMSGISGLSGTISPSDFSMSGISGISGNISGISGVSGSISGITGDISGVSGTTPTSKPTNGDHSGPTDEYGFSTSRPKGGKLSEEEANKQSELLVKALMKDFGLTKDQAIGVAANIYHESDGLNPHVNEYGSTPGGNDFGAPNDSQFGYGWCQWTGSRKQDYINFCNQNGYETGSASSNYAFLKHELSGNAKDDPQTNGAIDKVKQTSSADEATRVFNAEFERPTMPVLEKRLAYASFLETSVM